MLRYNQKRKGEQDNDKNKQALHDRQTEKRKHHKKDWYGKCS